MAGAAQRREGRAGAAVGDLRGGLPAAADRWCWTNGLPLHAFVVSVWPADRAGRRLCSARSPASRAASRAPGRGARFALPFNVVLADRDRGGVCGDAVHAAGARWASSSRTAASWARSVLIWRSPACWLGRSAGTSTSTASRCTRSIAIAWCARSWDRRGRERTPDPFTGFDPQDNPRMARPRRRPEPRTAVPGDQRHAQRDRGERNTAWSERKGESFTITPNACGAAYLLRRKMPPPATGARRLRPDHRFYAGSEKETGPKDVPRGITLGNGGRSVRRCGQPEHGLSLLAGDGVPDDAVQCAARGVAAQSGDADTWELSRAKPPNALVTLFRELLGLSDDRGKAVYLSDGGHFENLGLYEMVRRRCRHIVVVDAGADPDADFEDLGNAVRKIRIDFDNSRSSSIRTVAIGSRAETAQAVPLLRLRQDPLSGRRDRTGRADLHQAVRPAGHADGRARLSQRSTRRFPHQSTPTSSSARASSRAIASSGCPRPRAGAGDAASLAALFALCRQQLRRRSRHQADRSERSPND